MQLIGMEKMPELGLDEIIEGWRTLCTLFNLTLFGLRGQVKIEDMKF